MARVEGNDAAAYLGVFAYFVTFFLIGVWHGRTSVFAVFGILQGLGVSLNKLYQVYMGKAYGKKGYRRLSESWWYQSMCRGLTFTYFAFSLVWFWSNWTQMGEIVHALGWAAIAGSWLLVWVVATVLLAGYESFRRTVLSIHWHSLVVMTSRYAATVAVSAMIVVMVLVLNVLSVPAPDIVYKAF